MSAPPAGTAPNWLVVLAVVLTAIGGGGGTTAVVLVIKQGRKLKADTTKVLTDAAIVLVEPLERRLAATEAERAQDRAALRRVEGELAAVRLYLRRLVRAIRAPDATLEQVRRLVASYGTRLGEGDD